VVLNEGYVVFTGTLNELAASSDPFLHEYLGASRLDRTRHDQIIQRVASGTPEPVPA
jgi:ABC-type transporter Mla maintaining outer membrane lipid asymmetry ATPase subunit MlaF